MVYLYKIQLTLNYLNVSLVFNNIKFYFWDQPSIIKTISYTKTTHDFEHKLLIIYFNIIELLTLSLRIRNKGIKVALFS